VAGSHNCFPTKQGFKLVCCSKESYKACHKNWKNEQRQTGAYVIKHLIAHSCQNHKNKKPRQPCFTKNTQHSWSHIHIPIQTRSMHTYLPWQTYTHTHHANTPVHLAVRTLDLISQGLVVLYISRVPSQASEGGVSAVHPPSKLLLSQRRPQSSKNHKNLH